jgi:hypothetical protein
MRKLVFFICMMICFASIAQNKSSPCSTPEASHFDFWIGDWNLTHNDTLHATNHVEKIMGGCTVQENFHDPNTVLASMSATGGNRKQSCVSNDIKKCF